MEKEEGLLRAFIIQLKIHIQKNWFTQEKETCWRHNKEEMQKLAEDKRLYWGVKGTAKTPMRKLFLSEAKQGMTTPSIWTDLPFNQHAAREIELLFGQKAFFETPKPIELIKLIIHIASQKDSIILDSFAGSGTTAHSILNLNKEDRGHRKFILIEMENYANDTTAGRVKKAINGYGTGEKAVEGTGGEFDYYELGPPLFLENDNLNEEVGITRIREYIWYSETRMAIQEKESDETYLLGVKEDTAYYFIYERELLTTLNYSFLASICVKATQYVIYADNCLLPKDYLMEHNIIFKKIPRDISRF